MKLGEGRRCGMEFVDITCGLSEAFSLRNTRDDIMSYALIHT